jgi:hypothetical protein
MQVILLYAVPMLLVNITLLMSAVYYISILVSCKPDVSNFQKIMHQNSLT